MNGKIITILGDHTMNHFLRTCFFKERAKHRMFARRGTEIDMSCPADAVLVNSGEITYRLHVLRAGGAPHDFGDEVRELAAQRGIRALRCVEGQDGDFHWRGVYRLPVYSNRKTTLPASPFFMSSIAF